MARTEMPNNPAFGHPACTRNSGFPVASCGWCAAISRAKADTDKSSRILYGSTFSFSITSLWLATDGQLHPAHISEAVKDLLGRLLLKQANLQTQAMYWGMQMSHLQSSVATCVTTSPCWQNAWQASRWKAQKSMIKTSAVRVSQSMLCA